MTETSINVSTHRLVSYSLLLSLVTIIAVVWINFTIAARFDASTGKTRALFGIIEMTYSYKYFFATGGILATILAIVALRSERRQRKLAVVAIVLGLASLLLVFVRFWTLMIDHSA